MSLVMRCDQGDYDALTHVCSDPYWSEDIGFLPPLPSADAVLIAGAIGGCWMVGFLIRAVRKTALEAAP